MAAPDPITGPGDGGRRNRDEHSRLQDAMFPLMTRGTGGFSPDQICRALHAALDGDVDAALLAVNESP